MASKSNKTVTLSTSGVVFADVIDVARHDAKVELSQSAIDAMNASRTFIEGYAAGGVPVYGVSTGFGALANRHIDVENRAQLQKSLIRSHAAGVGPAIEREVVRALMFLRLRTMASGRTGVRVALAQSYVDFLNSLFTKIGKFSSFKMLEFSPIKVWIISYFLFIFKFSKFGIISL